MESSCSCEAPLETSWMPEMVLGGGSVVGVMANARGRKERWGTSLMAARVGGEVLGSSEISVPVGVAIRGREGNQVSCRMTLNPFELLSGSIQITHGSSHTT